MRAALIEQYNIPMQLANVADPACPDTGAIVAVKACGVCRSDWHGWKGADPDISLPHVPGHEFAGVVVAVGKDCQHVALGQRVTAPFILACGSCADCASGAATICANQQVVGFTGWGAFAEFVAVEAADFNLVPLPDNVGFAAAAGMGCRFTTAFRALADRAQLRPGEKLAVHGCGGIGLSAIVIAAAMEAEIYAIDVNPTALALAKDLGAHHLIQTEPGEDAGSKVREISGGGVHVSLDGLGITDTYLNSLRSLRKLGRHVQIGMPLGLHANPVLPLLDLVYSRQISLFGTRGMGADRFADLFQLITDKGIDLGRLVNREIKLSEAGAAIAAMDRFDGAGISVITDFQN